MPTESARGGKPQKDPSIVHDVAILSDFRYPGGTSASIGAEVHAQAEAALSTVLVHVPSPHQPRALPFSPRISELLRDGVAVLARDGRAGRTPGCC